MAEVGESKTEIRAETKTSSGFRKRENEKGNHKRTKKEAMEKGGLRKFELVDGSFQELGVGDAPGGVGGVSY